MFSKKALKVSYETEYIMYSLLCLVMLLKLQTKQSIFTYSKPLKKFQLQLNIFNTSNHLKTEITFSIEHIVALYFKYYSICRFICIFLPWQLSILIPYYECNIHFYLATFLIILLYLYSLICRPIYVTRNLVYSINILSLSVYQHFCKIPDNMCGKGIVK